MKDLILKIKRIQGSNNRIIAGALKSKFVPAQILIDVIESNNTGFEMIIKKLEQYGNSN